MHNKLNRSIWFQAIATAVAVLSLLGIAHAEDAGKIVQTFGSARLGDAAANTGDTVRTGDALSTGADGYIYLKTIDGGFLILRPLSQARVLAYHVDAAEPGNTRIKIELQNGVARSISGAAVKNARQHFRFNTPVAAIGVRGTDFTVFTNDQTTRVAVMSGGVVISGFDATCGPEGGGPCEGSSKRELFAGREAQVLEVNRGQAMPQLLRGNALAPDTSAPPRPDEPAKTSANTTGAMSTTSAASTIDAGLAPLKLASLNNQLLGQAPMPQAPAVPLPPAPVIVWGRWQALLGNPAEIDLTALRVENNLVGLNSYYALLRNKDTVWQSPAQGSAHFLLQNSQAVVQADGAGTVWPASVENGKLKLDFTNSRFATQLDLVTQGQRIALFGVGTVFKDGTFGNPSQFLAGNNMLVQGQLANDPTLRAAYLFQSRLDTPQISGQVASGVTYWGTAK